MWYRWWSIAFGWDGHSEWNLEIFRGVGDGLAGGPD